MRLVDADHLVSLVNDATILGDGFKQAFTAIVNGEPTIEPERKTGKWIKKMRITKTKEYVSYDPEWYCANCKTKYEPYMARNVNFCYVCGTDMRGEQDGESKTDT